jgi:putative DNA methylase
MDFCEFLQDRRERRKLSLRAAARELGVHASYLLRVEAGRVPPSDQLLRGLPRVLDCSEDELLLLAGRVPTFLRSIVERDPPRAATALREYATCVSEDVPVYGRLGAPRGRRAIEDGFPFEQISAVAEIESWRKEVYRPIYHVHKWWAQRLGSVFRAALLGAASGEGASVLDDFYRPIRLGGLVVFDPFMGSGTTVGEAHKLGCTVVGRDINPVAYRSVRTVLSDVDRRVVESHFRTLAETIGRELAALHRSIDSDGEPCDVLYWFWVKVLPCPACKVPVDLFSSYVFAQHAYVKRNPTVQVLCPGCGDVFPSTIETRTTTCPRCDTSFDAHTGPARHTTAVCRCGEEFKIAETARAADGPPRHRMYAKLVLRADGTKQYLPVTDADRADYEKARRRLTKLCPALPDVEIAHGHNTKQILNYGYRTWDQLFNERQLLGLSLLAGAIRDLPEGPARDVLALLFSGVLEFNNMFASYKGEGTGAVRHMFSHHILKPERTPIEANLWGTPKSSGSFSTLFESRVLRAFDYREAPFEIAVERKGGKPSGRKVFGASAPLGARVLDAWPAGGLPVGSLYLSCGDSAKTDLPDGSVDLVVTDPPFFDNVHYSELADFFFVWQELYFNGSPGARRTTTRQKAEVQDVDARSFAAKLGAVFHECHRVLRDDGLLVFSYHHSREDGWTSVARAVLDAGFVFVASQPVKAEMSVATPKSQAKEPIDVDVLVVCRRRENAPPRARLSDAASLAAAAADAESKVSRFNRVGRRMSRNDVRVVLLSQLLVELSADRTSAEVQTALTDAFEDVRRTVEHIWQEQRVVPGGEASVAAPTRADQMELFRAAARNS